MSEEQTKAIIEAILFTMGESVEAGRLAAALEISREQLKKLMEQMMEEFGAQNRGVRIIEIDGSYQMSTRPEAYEYLIRLVKIPRNYKLTDIQLETLSIIAYKQPITKLEIEKIRGVSSDYAVNRLVEAGLVEEVGRLDQPGKPIQFGTTEEFLRRFGLKNTDSLPELEVEKVETFKLEAEQELGFVSDPKEEKKEEQKELSGDAEEKKAPSGDAGEQGEPSGDSEEQKELSGDPGEQKEPSGDPGEQGENTDGI